MRDMHLQKGVQAFMLVGFSFDEYFWQTLVRHVRHVAPVSCCIWDGDACQIEGIRETCRAEMVQVFNNLANFGRMY